MTAPFGSDEELIEMQDCAEVAAERTRLREALRNLLEHCDDNPEGETTFERDVKAARAALALPAPAPKPAPPLMCDCGHWEYEHGPMPERNETACKIFGCDCGRFLKEGAPKPATETPAEARLLKLFEEHLAQFSPEEQERRVNAALAVSIGTTEGTGSRNSVPPQPDADLLALVRAARLPRNVMLHDSEYSDRFKGEWVVVPLEDFEKLRAALAPYAQVGTE